MVKVGIYKGFQTTIPSKIRKEMNITLDDELDWKIKDGDIIIKVENQGSLDELAGLYSWDEKTDAVELKKRS